MKFLSLIIALIFLGITSGAQQPAVAKNNTVPWGEKTIVKDSSGTTIAYKDWQKLMASGHYQMKPENSNADSPYIIYRLSDEEFDKKMSKVKPRESDFFKTGADFAYFNARDINGNKINGKSLKGKILVLNYWFINCPPCRAEIPELNTLQEQYKDDSSIVFIAVSTDDRYSIKQFLKTNPYNYQIVDNGRSIAAENNITGYPTNVIVDHHGKVYFHSSGFGNSLIYWLNKSIKEIKSSMGKQESSISPQ